ncbi:hypothetical protein QBC35DRAFT_507423 [Podospora australis]|uniref:Uncharacterized protein n=1 Tax=Podospora australis TaxID=1536484 RepID=A0AAN6WLV6_9PEZI|nr:hypothetical protein QBC35DRAFT_507423 [Podospora australis]
MLLVELLLSVGIECLPLRFIVSVLQSLSSASPCCRVSIMASRHFCPAHNSETQIIIHHDREPRSSHSVTCRMRSDTLSQPVLCSG